ncbi:MAG: hypothetical protein RLZZ64_144 [Bacteroidota bacterium]
MNMKYKYLLGLILLVVSTASKAQQNNTTVFQAWADQQVCITGEEIWIDGYVSQELTNVKSITMRLVDRNGQTKSEVDVIPQRKGFNGYISIPDNLVSDYYFIDCFAKGINATSKLQPIMVINPRLAPNAGCPSAPLSSSTSNNNQITIKTTKEIFNPRSPVRLELEMTAALDQISVSAVMHDALSAKMDSISNLFPLSFNHNSNGELENEGQLISVSATTADGPLKNTKLIAGLKGSKSVIGTSITNELGVAKFILPLTYDPRMLVVSSLGSKKEKTSFIVGKTVSDNQLIQFPCLALNESMRPLIDNRIFNSRVTNRFYGINTKSVETVERDTSDFYGKPDVVFQLDDYVRFPNMEEVISEIIPQLRVKKNKEEMILQVLNTPYKTFFEQEALVLLDGVPVTNTKALIEADPLLTKSIEIVARKYMQGNADFNGIVHFKTYRGDQANLQQVTNEGNFILNGLQETSSYQNLDHSKKADRLPDMRNLLWRDANINPDQIKSGLKYFTSDIEGNFKIIAKGINANKELVMGEKIIAVVKE